MRIKERRLEDDPVRVLHVGNLANYPFRLVTFLRRKRIDAELLLQLIRRRTEDPSMEDPRIDASSFPEWIRIWNNRGLPRIIRLLRIVREYDLIHAYTGFSIHAMFSLRPYIAHATGSDIRELAVENTPIGYLLRRSYRRARFLLFGNPDMIETIQKLGINNEVFLPNPIDTRKYSPNRENLRDRYSCRILIFHPPALEWRPKGNDLFLRAFAKLAKEVKDVFLLLSDRGPDRDRTKVLLKKLHVGQYVEFLPYLDQRNLIRYYNASDIVVDQFKVGSIGNIGLESLSCGKPVIAYISKKYFRLCYPEDPPILNARTTDQIYEKLNELVTDDLKRNRIGERSRAWVLNYHDVDKVIEKLIRIYKTVS